MDVNVREEVYNEARRHLLETQDGSISRLRAYLGIGYPDLHKKYIPQLIQHGVVKEIGHGHSHRLIIILNPDGSVKEHPEVTHRRRKKIFKSSESQATATANHGFTTPELIAAVHKFVKVTDVETARKLKAVIRRLRGELVESTERSIHLESAMTQAINLFQVVMKK